MGTHLAYRNKREHRMHTETNSLKNGIIMFLFDLSSCKRLCLIFVSVTVHFFCSLHYINENLEKSWKRSFYYLYIKIKIIYCFGLFVSSYLLCIIRTKRSLYYVIRLKTFYDSKNFKWNIQLNYINEYRKQELRKRLRDFYSTYFK